MSRLVLLALLLGGGCDLVPERLVEQGYDPDGDGVPWPDDCDSTDPARFPGAAEIWYDGIDQDCGLDDDYDRDGDGWIPSEYAGLPTAGVEGSGSLPGGDCWDEPEVQDEDLTVIPSSLADSAGQPLAWVQPAAAEVHPGTTEIWYDGVDQDCDGRDDLDQDGDGFRTSAFPDRSGVFGEDCIDGAPLDADNPAGIAPAEANPQATETWYDGTDQDCDDEDCDQDNDGQPADPEGLGYCTQRDCDDTDSSVGSGEDFEEIWYDGVDQDCDGDDGDQDGDGYWVADYEELVAEAGGEPLPIPAGMEGDCWDVPAEVEPIPEAFTAVNGYAQPAAAEVFPGATDTWYDGIDQDCGSQDDFDQDEDGAASDSVQDRTGGVGADCDDLDPSVNPWATELWYDGRDPNCDGNDGDMDGDGYWTQGYEALVLASGGTPMAVPLGYEGDCDDADAAIFPGAEEWCDGIDSDCDGVADNDALDAATWYADVDADAYGDPSSHTIVCTQPSGTVADATDCDDTAAAVNPGALEICDGLDDDCDGLVDHLDPDVVDALTWYSDDDADGYGDASDPGELWCSGDEPTGWLLSATDCDDDNTAINTAAVEVCDVVDNDCDGDIDEADALDAGTWYADSDTDGWGDAATSMVACDQPTGFVSDASDCDDSDPASYPGASEVVGDGVDQDCDGREQCYQDLDGDAWGSIIIIYSADLSCTDAGEAAQGGDCDDADAAVLPGAVENAADGVDQDCDGEELCYEDLDGDSYGGGTIAVSSDIACTASGFSPVDTDCDDTDPALSPGAEEVVADGVDQDCDGEELCYEDLDADGVGSSTEIFSSDLACASAGLTATSGDCDDTDPARSPALAEVPADGLDNDCDGSEACYEDLDADSFGTSATVASVDLDCSDSGESSTSDDCDDTDPTAYPGAVEVVADGVDQDCDGIELCWEDSDVDSYGSTIPMNGSTLDCSASGESTLSTDCDDTASTVNPAATEVVADGLDQDCDGQELCYEDLDGDSWGSSTTIASVDMACSDSGEADIDGDCDDGNPAVNPGAIEICDGMDSDCDGVVDEDAVDAPTWYPDTDLDGFGVVSGATLACSQPSGFSAVADDCDDTRPGVNPAAAEHCDGVDNDCDGVIDESSATDAGTWYADTDGDGFGDPADTTHACTMPSGYSADSSDCDDGDAGVYPGADEHCDGVDEDCDGVVDEDDAVDALTWYQDDDGDGWGVAGTERLACSQPSGYTAAVGDCDDTQAQVNPDAAEVCGNGQDDNCDGSASGCTPLGTISLSQADARLLGVAVGDAAGTVVAGAGDVDGDGAADLLVGASGESSAAGMVYLVMGPVSGDLSLDTAAVALAGERAGDYAGCAVAALPALGGHAAGAVVVGAYGADTVASGAGIAYLLTSVGGGAGSLGSADARLLGVAAGDAAGWSVASAGDHDLDGSTDLLVGAYGEDTAAAGAGAAYLVSGTVTGDFYLSGALASLRGEAASDAAGWSVAGPGDVDGDGNDDLLVGAPDHDASLSASGAAYLLLGPLSGDISLTDADARLLGASGDHAGWSVDGAGDVDGDGLQDLLVGAPDSDTAATDAGVAYLVLGAPGDALLSSVAEARLLGVAAGDGAGWSVAGDGDVDGDGTLDLLVGAPYAEDSVSASGAAYLLFGSLSGDIDLSDADALLFGEGTDALAGRAVAMPGDVDNDGWDDLFIAAPAADISASAAGAAYLVVGGGL